MTRPILYIAGPYSAGHGRTVAENIAVARRYAVAAANAGWMPFTPHLNTAGFEIDCPDVSHGEWLAGERAHGRGQHRGRPEVCGGRRKRGLDAVHAASQHGAF